MYEGAFCWEGDSRERERLRERVGLKMHGVTRKGIHTDPLSIKGKRE